MITYIPANIDIPWQGVENGAYFNDDGHGFAIASKSLGIEIYKSMDYDMFALHLAEARERHGHDSLVLVHARFATHGTTDEYNVHPFWVDEDTVMAHNGILPNEWHPAVGDKRSDTRVFVDRTAIQYVGNGVPSRRGGKTMGQMIGSGNKLVFLSVKNGEPKVRIVNAHLGVFTGGVWYSNDGYKDHGWGSRYYTNGWWNDYSTIEDTDGRDLPTTKDMCPWCQSVDTLDHASDTCTACEVCLTCNKWMGDCDCYLSESEKEGRQAREGAQMRGREVQLWTPDSSPLNPRFEPAEAGIEV